ncbi:hypothetical protein [Lysinibacillus capsici]|uniref:hypothetical protein n=2 Tax=Bacillaceae TaxID=186817 RepID=UPI0034E52417
MQDSRFSQYMNWNHKKEKCCEQYVKCYCHLEKKCEHKQEECKCKQKHEHCKWEQKKDSCSCKKEEEEYYYEMDYSKDHKCKGCICHQLRCLSPGTLVDVILAGGGSFAGIFFISLDPKTCCATFLEVDAAAATPLIIDCQQIIAIRNA